MIAIAPFSSLRVSPPCRPQPGLLGERQGAAGVRRLGQAPMGASRLNARGMTGSDAARSTSTGGEPERSRQQLHGRGQTTAGVGNNGQMHDPWVLHLSDLHLDDEVKATAK